jgi:hypothetical protein
MAREQSFFFDSVEGDRKYCAGDFSQAFESIFSNGVIASPPTSLRVVAEGAGRQVQVSYGSAIIKGRFYTLQDDETGPLIVPIPAGLPNNSTALIVARYSNATDVRRITIEVVGERMTAEAEYDLVLAQVVVSANIPQSAVTDTRYNPELCGVIGVAGLNPQRFAAAYEAFVAAISGGTPVLQAHVANDVDSLPTDTAEVKHALGVDGAGELRTRIDGKQAVITGAASTITGANLSASRALMSDGNGKVAASAVTNAELAHLTGVTGGIQAQLNGKQATISGAASTIAGANLSASRALVSNSSGKVAASGVTESELGRLSGVTGAIQTQLNAKITGVVPGGAIKFGATQPSLAVGDIWLKDLGRV